MDAPLVSGGGGPTPRRPGLASRVCQFELFEFSLNQATKLQPWVMWLKAHMKWPWERDHAGWKQEPNANRWQEAGRLRARGRHQQRETSSERQNLTLKWAGTLLVSVFSRKKSSQDTNLIIFHLPFRGREIYCFSSASFPPPPPPPGF